MNNTPTPMTHERMMVGVEYVSYSDYLKLQKELEEAKEPFKIFYNERSKLEKERDEAREAFAIATDQMVLSQCKLREANALVEKAKELVSKWDQPSWKDTTPTAVFISALRDAIKSYEEKKG